MEKRQNQIENYLNNEMPKGERQDFESDLERDKSLQESLKFQKGMQEYMDERNPDFENILSEMGGKYFQERKSNLFFLKWWIYIPIILIILVGIWRFLPLTSTTPIKAIPSEPSVIVPLKTTEDKPTSPIEEPKIEQEKEATPVTPIDNSIENQPIASLNPDDFKRNNALESIISEKYRNDIFTEMTFPKKNQVFAYNKGVNFKVKGNTTASPPYQLIVYSNQVSDFDNDYRLLDKELDGFKSNDEFQFRFNAEIPFKQGLYYLILQDESEGAILYISRFEVK